MREIKFRAWIFDSRRMLQHDDMPEVLLHDLEKLKSWHFMQYTGLKDKNGKEIWEGDIIKMFNGQPVEVAFERIIAAFHMGGQPMTEVFCRNSEILGNIYENPELLK